MGAEHNGKGLKDVIHQFWDTLQHFLKTHFCLESGFPSYLELQASLLVSYQGCWTQWQRFESSSIHHFWDTQQYFLKTHFCLESGFPSYLELQISLLVSFQGTHFCLESGFLSFPRASDISTSKFPWVLNTMAHAWKLWHSPILRYPTVFSQNTFLLRM